MRAWINLSHGWKNSTWHSHPPLPRKLGEAPKRCLDQAHLRLVFSSSICQVLLLPCRNDHCDVQDFRKTLRRIQFKDCAASNNFFGWPNGLFLLLCTLAFKALCNASFILYHQGLVGTHLQFQCSMTNRKWLCQWQSAGKAWRLSHVTGLCIILYSFHLWKHLYGHVWCDTSPSSLSTSRPCRMYNSSWLYVGYWIDNPGTPMLLHRFIESMGSSNAHSWKCLVGEDTQIKSSWGYGQYICYHSSVTRISHSLPGKLEVGKPWWASPLRCRRWDYNFMTHFTFRMIDQSTLGKGSFEFLTEHSTPFKLNMRWNIKTSKWQHPMPHRYCQAQKRPQITFSLNTVALEDDLVCCHLAFFHDSSCILSRSPSSLTRFSDLRSPFINACLFWMTKAISKLKYHLREGNRWLQKDERGPTPIWRNPILMPQPNKNKPPLQLPRKYWKS